MESAKLNRWTLKDPIVDILGFRAYAAAFWGHLTKIILNVFTKESCFLILFRLKRDPIEDHVVLCTFTERSVEIQPQGVFKARITLMSENVYMGGGGLVQYILQTNRREKSHI